MKQIIAKICKVFHTYVFLKRKGRHRIVINTPDIFYFIDGEVLHSKDFAFISVMYNMHVL